MLAVANRNNPLPDPLLGTSPHLITGPTAVMSIMTKKAVQDTITADIGSEDYRQIAFALSLLVGLLQVSSFVAAAVVGGDTHITAVSWVFSSWIRRQPRVDTSHRRLYLGCSVLDCVDTGMYAVRARAECPMAITV